MRKALILLFYQINIHTASALLVEILAGPCVLEIKP